MNKKRFITIALLLALVLVGSMILTGATDKEFQQNMTPLVETLYYILNYYYDIDNVNVDKVIDYGIDGLIKGLGDDFSYYYNEEIYQ